jgi:hypothetical protein
MWLLCDIFVPTALDEIDKVSTIVLSEEFRPSYRID